MFLMRSSKGIHLIQSPLSGVCRKREVNWTGERRGERKMGQERGGGCVGRGLMAAFSGGK